MQFTTIYINGNKKRWYEKSRIANGRVKVLQILSKHEQVSCRNLLKESNLTYFELIEIMKPWFNDGLVSSEVYYTLNADVQVVNCGKENDS